MTTGRVRLLGATVAAGLLAALAGPRVDPAAGATADDVGHVFVIVLENKDYDVTFGADSPAPYLAQTLPGMGQLLTQYHGIGHVSLDNYIAMISGQAPNPITQSDCLVFQDFVPPAPVLDGNGQAVGLGCVYPAGVQTLPDQLEAAGRSWRGYLQDMGTPCRHPAIGAVDDTQSAEVGDQYATRHNPFVYFHSIIDDDASCRQHVVDLDELTDDLASAATTPALSFISPDLCHDAHDEPCVDGKPGGLVTANAFLEEWVPRILASPAYQADGLLVVTFDEAEVGDPSSAAACCGEVPGPNSPLPGIVGPGGGRVGGVVLSPFVTPGTVNDTPYNHYSLLRSIENIFGLPHLGFAAAPGVQAFGDDVFAAPPPAGNGSDNGSDDGSDGGPGTSGGGSTPLTPTGGTGSGRLPATGAAAPTAWIAAAALAGALGLVGRRAVRGRRTS
jgi:phospholipase C